MATKRPSFEKRQREQAAKAKAAAKRDRRQARAADAENPETESTAPTPARAPHQQLDMAEVLVRVDALQQRLEAGKISYDDFDAQKAALLASLPIE